MFLPICSVPVQGIERIDRDENLYCAHRVEHVGVVAWGGGEASIRMLTGQHEADGVFSRKAIGVAHQMQGGQPPIDPVQTQVFGEPVLVLIFSLSIRSCQMRADRRSDGPTVSRLLMYCTCRSTIKVRSTGRSAVLPPPPLPGPDTSDILFGEQINGVLTIAARSRPAYNIRIWLVKRR